LYMVALDQKNYLFKSNHIIETFRSVSLDTVISGIKLPNF
jgi:hypothetical protein